MDDLVHLGAGRQAAEQHLSLSAVLKVYGCARVLSRVRPGALWCTVPDQRLASGVLGPPREMRGHREAHRSKPDECRGGRHDEYRLVQPASGRDKSEPGLILRRAAACGRQPEFVAQIPKAFPQKAALGQQAVGRRMVVAQGLPDTVFHQG